MKLTNKQRLFVEEYFACGMNGTEAARRAGYSGDAVTLASVASENLRKPHIREAVEARFKEIAMSRDEVLARLTDIARGDMADFWDYDSLSIDLKKAARSGSTKLIKKLKFVSRTDDDGQTDTVEFELYSAHDALVQLGKFHKLFAERVQIDDWRSELIALLKEGKVSPDVVREELGNDLAEELFKLAGVPIAASGEG